MMVGESRLLSARDPEGSDRAARDLLCKVPQVTVFFWVIKVLCTTVGETASDFLNERMGFGLRGTAVAAGVCLLIVLFAQFRVKKYTPAVYWLAVVLISVFGTLITDILTDSLKFPLEASTIVFSVALGLTFAAWYAKERTLSIHSIFTRRREAFYWLAILFTFALGTATGDLVAEKLGVGYLHTGLLVLGIIAAAGVAWRLGLNSVLAFWIAYILTRPLGASLGDYLSQSREHGGLGFGATVTSEIFLTAILAVVIYLALTRKDFIDSPTDASATERAERGAVLQVAATLVVLLGIGVTGYYMRRSQLERQAAASSTRDRPLGDLSAFRTIAQEMQRRVHSSDWTGARAKAADLETAWDDNQARLQRMNLPRWTLMDGAIDDVLRRTRSTAQDTAATGAALESFVAVMDSIDRRNVGERGPNTAPQVSGVGVTGDVVRRSHLLADAAPSTSPDRPLGDLSAFRTITQDLLQRVHSGDRTGAREKATDLETLWDNNQPRLRSMSPQRWTSMDGAIDAVLRTARSTSLDTAAATAALESLLAAIDSLDHRD